MADHPSPVTLEQWQVDRADAEITRHVETCDACRQYVADLDRARHSFLLREQPEDFVRRVRQAETAEPRRPGRLAWWMMAPAAGVALVLALVVLLLPGTRTTEEARMRLKGEPQLAVILLRQGAQTRHTGALTLMARDRLRVELTLPSRQTLTVGIFERGKRWLPLVEEETLEAGVHHLQQSLLVDAQPTAGWIVAGRPDAVREVVSRQRIDGISGVISLRLRVGGEP